MQNIALSNIKLTFTYFQNVSYSEYQSKTVVFTRYDYDKFTKSKKMGEILVPLIFLDLREDVEEWRDLTSPKVRSPPFFCSLFHEICLVVTLVTIMLYLLCLCDIVGILRMNSYRYLLNL